MGGNFTQKQLEKFRKDHMDKSRLPRGLVEALFERLKTTVDTTNMDAHGLSAHLSKRKNFNKIKVWEEAAEECLQSISENEVTASSNNETSPIATCQDEVKDDNYRVVSTTLRQIIRDEHNLADIDHSLTSEKEFNDSVFKAFCCVIQFVRT
jgi:hypothetical protein